MYKDSSSVESYLVDSQAWNHICKNIFHANKGSNDSTTWGNYYNNTTTDYQKLDCLWAAHKNISNTWTVAKNYQKGNINEIDVPKGSGETRIELSTGASEDFKRYNIYDMAGNLAENTTGHSIVKSNNGSYEMFVEVRGASFNSSGQYNGVVGTWGDKDLSLSNFDIGFRVVLYVK